MSSKPSLFLGAESEAGATAPRVPIVIDLSHHNNAQSPSCMQIKQVPASRHASSATLVDEDIRKLAGESVQFIVPQSVIELSGWPIQ